MKDEAGKPIFVVKQENGFTEFFPYNIGTIHEFIKAKEEMKEQKEVTKKSGAV